jgi:hypothetical protein
MKPADLKPGTTYVGKNGRRRHLHAVTKNTAVYDVPEGGTIATSAARSARWAARAPEPHERAP